MKKVLGITMLSVSLVASWAMAIDMTPEQAMHKMMSCTSCKPMMEYPQLGPQIRYDVHETDTGFVSAFMLADEKLVPQLRECESKCAVTRKTAMDYSPKEAEEHLCPFCSGMHGLMSRGDIEVEEFTTALGKIVVATSSTSEGVKALHAYASMARDTSALLARASMQMKDPHAGHDHSKHGH